MKSIADLILDLQHATGRDRQFDIAIALVLGFKQQVTHKKNAEGQKERNVVWLFPDDTSKGRIPYFTAKIDAAKDLATTIVPGCTGGFTWSPGKYSARLNGGPIFSAATPALAICVAALSAKYMESMKVNDGETESIY